MCATAFGIDVKQDGPQTITHAEVFARQHFFARQIRFGVTAEINDQAITRGFLNDAGENFADTVTVSIDHQGTLSFTNSLHDNLLSGLRSNTTKSFGLNFFFDDIAKLQAFFFYVANCQLHRRDFVIFISNDFPKTEGFVLTGTAIDSDANIDLVVFEALNGGSG